MYEKYTLHIRHNSLTTYLIDVYDFILQMPLYTAISVNTAVVVLIIRRITFFPLFYLGAQWSIQFITIRPICKSYRVTRSYWWVLRLQQRNHSCSCNSRRLCAEVRKRIWRATQLRAENLVGFVFENSLNRFHVRGYVVYFLKL